MSQDLVIEATGLRKNYGSTVALDGLDLEMAQGEVLSLLGPNGAGKTTTVEILEGYRKRDAGEARVLGEDPQRAGSTWRARRGIVLQSCEDVVDLTVSECVRHFAHFYPAPADPEEVIERVGLGEKRNSRIRGLSGGQRRRLDVALGIVGKPELVFLDEPTTGFDPQARRQFWDVVRDLSREGTSVLLTTHYLEEAEALADRVAVVNRGRVVASGTPRELGGRQEAAARVSWLGPGGWQHSETREPTALVRQLEVSFGGEIPGLTVARPTLEDIYLRLIGEASCEEESCEEEKGAR
ncbi:MAG TPA: ABC transporter ATP-binding protein [Acidimicrobiales bacterium]|nr:ABC transporter ATP-binding protein [Acidimicrobiales bacterium]